MYKHTLSTKYQSWTEASKEVVINNSETNPFHLFDINNEMKRIQEDVELAKKQSLERGGDGEIFKSNWSFTRTAAQVEAIKSLGIDIVIEMEYGFCDSIQFRTCTVSGYKRIKEYEIVIPEQLYTIEQIEINPNIQEQIDSLEKRAQWLWDTYDPEPAIGRLYEKALGLCKTDAERDYVKSRAWS